MTDFLPVGPSGPHSDDTTIEVADRIEAAMRVLAYAACDRDGVTEPATVYTVMGALAQTAAAMGTVLENLAGYLDRTATANRLGRDGATSTAETVAHLRSVFARFGDADHDAEQLQDTLNELHSLTAPLHLCDPTPGGGGEES